MPTDDGFEAFAKRIRAGAESVPLVKAGRQTTLAALSKADQNAYIDRCWADGIDPLGAPAEPPGPPKLTVAEKRAAMNAPLPEEAGEVFYGWVQRACDDRGYEWAFVQLPRYVVEGNAIPDRVGRAVRTDTREVMTKEIIGELISWNLGKKTRPDPDCRHKYVVAPGGRRECVQCGTPEASAEVSP